VPHEGARIGLGGEAHLGVRHLPVVRGRQLLAQEGAQLQRPLGKEGLALQRRVPAHLAQPRLVLLEDVVRVAVQGGLPDRGQRLGHHLRHQVGQGVGHRRAQQLAHAWQAAAPADGGQHLLEHPVLEGAGRGHLRFAQQLEQARLRQVEGDAVVVLDG
jgi:hypothetical protein